MKRPPRTSEIIARGAVKRFVHSQKHLDEFLRQFTPAHRVGVSERIRPHLNFEPKAK
jgi:hypothetical protein